MVKKKNYKIEALQGTSRKINGYGGGAQSRNMVFEGGINKKRSGWRVVANLAEQDYTPLKINGIFEFKGEKSALIVHAGTKLYEFSYDMQEKRELVCQDGVVINDTKSQGQMCGTLLWLTGMGELLVYDGEIVRRAYNHENAYIPTTTVGIHDNSCSVLPSLKEKPNLLTPKRRNSLRGIKTSNGQHHFTLDTAAKYGEPFDMKISFRVRMNGDMDNSTTTSYIGVYENGEQVNTVVNVHLHTDNLMLTIYQSNAVAYDDAGSVVNIDGLVYHWCLIAGVYLVLGFDALSPYIEKDNILVEYTEDRESALELNSARGITVATRENGRGTVILPVGDKLYMSGEKELYFPNEPVPVGADNEAVTALVPLWDFKVGVYKKSSYHLLSLQGNDSFSISQGSYGGGAYGPNCAACVDGDALSLGENGIYGICESLSGDRVVHRLYNRATELKSQLAGYTDKESACAVYHNESFYLFIGEVAYVTTPFSRVYRNGSSERELEYDWWVLDNCPATSVISAQGRLYMGRKNGEIAVFDGGYTDRRERVLTERERDFVFSNKRYTVLTFNEGAEVGAGDKICLPDHFAYLLSCTYSKDTDLVYVSPGRYLDENGAVALYCGMEIKLMKDGRVVYEGEILGTTPSEYAFSCGRLGVENGAELELYIKRGKETEYLLTEVEGDLMLFYNEIPTLLYSTEIERVYIVEEKEIECYLYTPVLDLKSKGAKALYGVIVTPTPDTRCALTVGYETAEEVNEQEITVGTGLDFDSLDYGDFSFAPYFKRDVKAYLFLRNFDYIRIKIGSKRGKGLGIESVHLIYS